MTAEEIKCANCIIERAFFQNATEAEIVNSNLLSPHIFKIVAQFLKDEGLIEIGGVGGGWAKVYELTSKGNTLHKSGKGIEGYLKDKEETNARKTDKEQRDDYFRTLQIKDLEEKLNVMNVEQRDFWKAQKAKNLQTTLIAIISALFSLIALMKTWGFFE